MLTRGLLRFRLREGRVEPGFLRPTPAVQKLAEELLQAFAAAVGGRRKELEEQLVLVVNRSRSALAGRGLARVLEQLCRYREPPSAGALRQQAFALSAPASCRSPAS